MNHRNADYLRFARRRGSAMTEMVLVLPIVLVFLALLLYFGRGMMRVQRVAVLDRYEAWRTAAYAPGPTGDIELNQLFMGNRAENLQIDHDGAFPAEAGDRLIARAQQRSAAAGLLTQEAIASLPAGVTVKVSATHPNRVQLYEPFEGPIRHRHIRLGSDWRHGNGWREIDWAQTGLRMQWPEHGSWYPAGPGAHVSHAITRSFYQDFDFVMQSMSAGNDVAQSIRYLYRGSEGYRGPYVEYSD